MLGICKSQRDDHNMSFWTLETKADIGICGFSNTVENLFRELTLGMMHLLVSTDQAKKLDSIQRRTAQWNTNISNASHDYELLIIIWLEEVLYKLEVESKFLVDAQFMIKHEQDATHCRAQVSWVDADLVTRDVEIKAVTSHELSIAKLNANEVFTSNDVSIPELVGPAWVGTVIFDI